MESIMDVSALYTVAEVELVYKSKVKASNRPVIASSKDAYGVLKQSWDENKIELKYCMTYSTKTQLMLFAG